MAFILTLVMVVGLVLVMPDAEIADFLDGKYA